MSILTEVRSFLSGLVETPFGGSGQKLLVGVSGGPDSLCLLHVLKQLYPANCLLAVHLNHQLRASAGIEAEMVAAIAADWGVAAVMGAVDVKAMAQEQGLTLEEAGRIARYQLFAQAAAEYGISHAAVAHHADDQVETVLMHLLRGTGLSGLQGMLPHGPMPTAPEITLLRPLLSISRSRIETYCSDHSLPFIEDASNQDVEFFRNRIRHELIPELIRYTPQIKSHLLQLASATAGDFDFVNTAASDAFDELIQGQGEGWISFSLERWVNLHLSVKRAVLRKAVQKLLPLVKDIGFKTIEQARTILDQGKSGTQSHLPGSIKVQVDASRVIIAIDDRALADSVAVPQLKDGKAIELSVPGCVELEGGWVLEAELVESPNLSEIFSNPNPWAAYIAFDKEKLIVRGRVSGDRAQPLGMSGKTISLKDLMINHKIPARTRARWPLLVDEERLVWLPGYQIDDDYKVAAESRRVVCLRCSQLRKAI